MVLVKGSFCGEYTEVGARGNLKGGQANGRDEKTGALLPTPSSA